MVPRRDTVNEEERKMAITRRDFMRVAGGRAWRRRPTCGAGPGPRRPPRSSFWPTAPTTRTATRPSTSSARVRGQNGASSAVTSSTSRRSRPSSPRGAGPGRPRHRGPPGQLPTIHKSSCAPRRRGGGHREAPRRVLPDRQGLRLRGRHCSPSVARNAVQAVLLPRRLPEAGRREAAPRRGTSSCARPSS